MERAEAGLERARRCRWAGVGRSAHPDAALAGREAARAALAEHDDAGLLIVFASADYDLRALTAGVSEVAAGIPVAGCAAVGEIDASGAGAHSVVVLALGGAGFSFSTAAVAATPDPRDAGARAAACIGDVADREHAVLLLLTDGPSHRQADVVRGAYSVAGAGVPLVGGVSGPAQEGMPSLVYGDGVLQDAVVGVAIGSDAPLGVGVRHGWRPTGDPLLVTRASRGRVLELDGRPAAAVYRERIGGGHQPGDVTLAHPLGMQRRVGEAHVRWVGDDDRDDGSLVAAIPAGAMVWLMESDVEGAQAATDAACREALDGLDGDPPQALLVFDCNARLRFLADGVIDEVARIVRHAGDAPVAGLYTYGEIARTRGSAGFHQQTLVVLAIA